MLKLLPIVFFHLEHYHLPIKHHGITTPKVNKPLNGVKHTGLRCLLQGTAETFHDKSLGDI